MTNWRLFVGEDPICPGMSWIRLEGRVTDVAYELLTSMMREDPRFSHVAAAGPRALVFTFEGPLATKQQRDALAEDLTRRVRQKL